MYSLSRSKALYHHELSQIALRDDSPNSLNGYRRLSLPRIAHAIAYFEQHIGNLYKTKLNKLLFYADFLAYKRHGYSITGLQYRAIDYGPVPAEYGRLFIRLQDDEEISVEERNGKDDQYFEVYRPNITFDGDQFSEEEISILQAVAELFAGKNSGDAVRLSHEESAWKENEGERQLITDRHDHPYR